MDFHLGKNFDREVPQAIQGRVLQLCEHLVHWYLWCHLFLFIWKLHFWNFILLVFLSIGRQEWQRVVISFYVKVIEISLV